MSVIFKMFIFTKNETKMKIKKNIFFIFGKGPSRFDLAATYLHQEWRIRVT